MAGGVGGWRRVALACALPVAGVACIPAEEHTPSGLTLLKYVGSTRISSLMTRGRRSPSYEVSLASTTTSGDVVEIRLCGVCHVEPASAAAARALVICHTPDAVALECDAATLDLIKVAGTALDRLPADAVRSQGLARVRRALFETPQMRELAESAGKPLREPANVGLPPLLARHLAEDGILWSDEMRAASEAADACGARVTCLGPIKDPRAAPRVSGRLSMFVGAAAHWLRARALRPGLDERSCEPAVVHALNASMQEVLPSLYRYHVEEPDRRMAGQIRSLCDEVVRERRAAAHARLGGGGAEEAAAREAGREAGSEAPRASPPLGLWSARRGGAVGKQERGAPSQGHAKPPVVVCVVGAQHVPGLQRALEAGGALLQAHEGQ